jgi:hypothetical protein
MFLPVGTTFGSRTKADFDNKRITSSYKELCPGSHKRDTIAIDSDEYGSFFSKKPWFTASKSLKMTIS